MRKKLLFAVVLLLTFVCLLVSCDSSDDGIPNTPDNSSHTHSYGEWEITKSATCTTEGAKERYCSCGEKQTSTIPVSHNIINGICSNCGYGNNNEDNSNSNNNTAFKKFTEDEWVEIFNITQYQSYLMKIVGSETTEAGYSEEIEVTIQFKNPCFKIASLQTEGYDKSWSNSDEETAFITGGIEELQKTVYIPHNISSFYETISNSDDFGYSKFLFEEESNTYSSNMFEGFESVEIKITNNKLDTIVLVKEYCDLDWGDTTERCTLNLFDINNTQKPEITKSEVNNYISQVKNSINKATKARKYYQSTDYYDVEQAIDTCDKFLNDLVTQHNNLKRFDSSTYSWMDYECDEYEEETNCEIILSCPETRYATMFNENVNYNEIHLSIENGKIVSVKLYQNSTNVCPIYFIYE